MRSFPYESPHEETISLHTSPAPKRRPWRRKACTDTPAIGASTIRDGISTSPMYQGEESWAMARRVLDASLWLM